MNYKKNISAVWHNVIAYFIAYLNIQKYTKGKTTYYYVVMAFLKVVWILL